MKPKALILHAVGTNRDRDAALAVELAGGEAEILPLNVLKREDRSWLSYQLLVIPGGFSYADALGAGRLLALDLEVYFSEQVRQFVESGKPVIGICNGFQALVKAGILPEFRNGEGNEKVNARDATLTFNASGRFECRWVTLFPRSSTCLWTRDLSEPIDCPVAHGEGNFVVREPSILEKLSDRDQIALVYANSDGSPANGAYPANPNGSTADIAGICNPQGNVLGLMPHPENAIFQYQHPRWRRGFSGRTGLSLFVNGIRAL